MGVLFLAVPLVLAPLACDDRQAEDTAPPDTKSDMNDDGVVDLEDLKLYAAKLGLDWRTLDWCAWIQGERENDEHLVELFAFVRRYYECGRAPPPPPEDPLAVKSELIYPTRLALGPDGRLYVTDPKVDSVFIYDADGTLVGELKGLDKPLGIAVDSLNNIYVGNNGRDNVEKYSSAGLREATFGTGQIRMPNDLALDRQENLYVADSLSNLVWVYAPGGAVLRTLRHGQLKFPAAVEVAYTDNAAGQPTGELYVGDQANFLVKVFDLQGNLLRSFGGFPQKAGMMGTTWRWEGRFVALQSLAVDAQGNLHALDSYMNKVQILDPTTGSYLTSYGEPGEGSGQLKLPLEIIINSAGEVMAANADKGQVEVIHTIP